MAKQKYYSVRKTIEQIPDAFYYVIFGERSNGKTYSVLDYALEDYFKNGNQLAIIRRYKEDLKGKNGASMFSALINNKLVEKYSKGEWNGIYYYSQRWFLLYINPENPKDKRVSEEPFAYGFALTDMEHDKSTSYPKIKNILFDEFITRSMYLPDEFVIFMNVLSTIIRERDDVSIFMCGNTVNKYCPYFKEMGLNNVRKMDKGKIDVYTYGESRLKVVVEYSDFPSKKKKSDLYFAFDNPKLSMVTRGDWEIALYPRLTYEMKYAPKDVYYHYFIQFEEDLLMCEIVRKGDYLFTFIHRKTTPIKDDDKSIVYNPEQSPKPNYRRKITSPMTMTDKRILWFFKNEKVFYQSNEIGEIVRNYFMWCKTATMENNI